MVCCNKKKRIIDVKVIFNFTYGCPSRSFAFNSLLFRRHVLVMSELLSLPCTGDPGQSLTALKVEDL